MFVKSFVIKPATVVAAVVFLFSFLCGSLYFLQARLEDTPVLVSETSIKVPIVMYHHINQRQGSQGAYVLSPDELEKDLVFLQKKGYTTIHMADLINYVYNGTSLPERPIVLTFDDGYESNYVYAYPLLQKHGMKGVIAVVGEYSALYSAGEDHNINYSHVTWDEIKELHDSGILEIQNHTYNLHTISDARRGSAIRKGENVEAYQKMLKEDLVKLQQILYEVTGAYPNTFVYPFGYVSKESLSVIRNTGFLASFSCEERINHIVRDPECLYLLGRYNRPHGKSPESFFQNILPQ